MSRAPETASRDENGKGVAGKDTREGYRPGILWVLAVLFAGYIVLHKVYDAWLRRDVGGIADCVKSQVAARRERHAGSRDAGGDDQQCGPDEHSHPDRPDVRRGPIASRPHGKKYMSQPSTSPPASPNRAPKSSRQGTPIAPAVN